MDPAEDAEVDVREAWRRTLRSLLLAGIVFAAILGGIFTYARTWPPMVSVESGSMQHSDTESMIGAIDTGDIVLVQAVYSRADVVTYLEGRAGGHGTYGDFGDVIVFRNPANLGGTVFIHRAIAYVLWNATAGAYDVPDLGRLPEEDWDAFLPGGAPTQDTAGIARFILYRAGWARDLTVFFNLTEGDRSIAVGGQRDGFLTMGDHNAYTTITKFDRWVIPVDFVIGRARGELPWFGLIKLTLFREGTGCCEWWGSTHPDRGAPANSWFGLNVSLGLLVGTPLAFTLLEVYLSRHPGARRRLREIGRELWPFRRKRPPGPEGTEVATEADVTTRDEE